MRNCTQAAPTPCPMRVTFFGSPLKPAIFSCTQCSAAIWSKIPRFDGCGEGGGGDGGVGVFSPLLLVVSIVGVGTNLGSIAIFMRQKFRKDFHRLLIILAAYDLLVSRSLLARLTSSATSLLVRERERTKEKRELTIKSKRLQRHISQLENKNQ